MAETGLFTDGGVIGRNPSALAGTWAWCLVGAAGREREACGTITPAAAGLPEVSNNLTELLAAVEGLEALPDGWAGTVHTDSKVTLYRVSRLRKQAKLNGIPEWLRVRLAAVKARLGGYTVRLLGGHPTREDLEAGFRKRGGLPVSIHNVYCDRLCGEQAERFRQSRRSLAKEACGG